MTCLSEWATAASIAWGSGTIGWVIGFAICAILTVGKRADERSGGDRTQ